MPVLSILICFIKPCQYVKSSQKEWLTLPNRPLNHPKSNDVSFCWLINATVPLTFWFTRFSTDEDSRLVTVSETTDKYYYGLTTYAINRIKQIYDGTSTSSTRLLQTSASEDVLHAVSSASKVLVTFSSDVSNSFSGLNLTYEVKIILRT